MKKCFFLMLAFFGLVLVTGCTVSVSRFAIPIDTSILQLGVGSKILPCDDAFTAVRIAPFWFGDDYVSALNVSGVSTSFANNGLAIGGILSAHEGHGVSASLVDYNEDHAGVRIGLFVWGEHQDGLQIGLFNKCSDSSHALQIGFVNWAGENESPRLLLNGSWGPNEEDSTILDPEKAE
ncbi:MAG: hypothetical protein Q4F99_00175 [bacterium]|nr:hypothetical protein [bacterium]